MQNPTASSLGRVIACPDSELLPHIHRTSEAAEAGTWRHWYLEHVGDLGIDEALKGVPEKHQEMCAAIDIEGLPVNMASEVAFAWDWRTGEARELGRGLHRDYSDCGPSEIAGTIDALGLSSDLIYLGDFKGWLPVAAKNNAQLLFAALCGTKVYGRSKAVLEIINVRNSENWRSKVEVDTFDLAAFASKLRATMETIEERRESTHLEYEVTEGDHCKFCPAFDSCPAKIRMLTAMAGGETIPTLSPETAALAYRTARAMKALTDVAWSRIYAYAQQNPIDLGDGVIFGERETPGKESLDGDATFEIIGKRLGQKYADESVSRKATKAGVTRAIRLAKRDGVITGTQKAENESILTELRASGAATRKPSTVIEEHRPKRQLT